MTPRPVTAPCAGDPRARTTARLRSSCGPCSSRSSRSSVASSCRAFSHLHQVRTPIMAARCLHHTTPRRALLAWRGGRLVPKSL
eukprot:1696591-Alexandrium_andersonii.AAC.1